MNNKEAEQLHTEFYEMVVLAYDAYRSTRKKDVAGSRNDLKSALAVATAAYHFREHLPPSLRNTRAQMAQICADYDLLGDVANASKHDLLTQGNPQINSADDIREFLVSTFFEDEHGVYTSASKSIEISLKDGTKRELFDVLTNVVNMWVSFLHDAGVSDRSDLFKHEDRNRIISRAEAKRGIDLVGTQGLALTQGLKVQKYDYQKGRPEPIDLTGVKFEFSLYDPKSLTLSTDIQMVSSEGKKYTASVDLDPDEANEYLSLKTGAQLAEFHHKMLMRRGEVILRSEQTDLPGPSEVTVKATRPPDQSEPKA